MTDDNINRKAALNCVYGTSLNKIKGRIAELPSATDTNVGGNLIDREMALDVLHGYFDGMLETDTVCPKDLYNEIEALPSAQPDVPDTNVGDTISRQAAIETVRKAQSIGQAHRMIIQMPTAQRHGTWIVRRFGADAKCSECGMYCVGAYDYDRCDQYCRFCGAKMDGLKLEGGQDERSD